MSVMEISHRSKAFMAVAQQAEADLRELLAMPANYKVLFLQGGATAQFSAVPMNLLRAERTADYVNTGSWSKKALGEAKRYCQSTWLPTPRPRVHAPCRRSDALATEARAAYLHYTPNETIGGVEFPFIPDSVMCRWWRICPRTFCRDRSMSAASA